MQVLNDNFDPNSKKGVSSAVATLGLSALLHVLFLTWHYAPTLPLTVPETKEKEPVEIADYNEILKQQRRAKAQVPPVSKEQQMAETEEAQNRDLDPNAKFLGAHNQTAPRDQKAARIDDFRTKQGTGAKGLPQLEKESMPPTTAEGKKSEEIAEEGTIPTDAPQKTAGVKRDWKTLSLKDLSVSGDGGATAATDDRLAQVDRGERTILSTREYKFFGYYHRIKELLRQYWKPNVEHQLTRIWGKGRQVTDDELTTRVLVLLDEKGGISKISKLGSSGYSELDEAAVAAFQAAAPFPNPPKAMMDEDGFVRIRWDFILTTDNGPRIQFRNVGSVPQY